MKENFDQEQWAAVTETPLLVFQAVAGADGKIDKKEKKAFQNALNSNKVSDSLTKEVMISAKAQYSNVDTIPDYTLSDIALKLQAVHQITKENIDEESALLFKKGMLALGLYIGNSSGGFFGSNLSDEEINALKKVGSYMSVSITQLQQNPTVQEIVSEMGG